MIGALIGVIGSLWKIIVMAIMALIFIFIYAYFGITIVFSVLLIVASIFFLIRIPAFWRIAILPLAIGVIIFLLSIGGLI